MINGIHLFAASSLSQSWPWYLTRASGFIAAGLLILLLISGITSFTGHYFKFMEPLKAWANHRAIGIAFAVTALIHILSLLFDKFVSFDLVELFVPFASDYQRISVGNVAVGSLAMALGIFSLYMVGLIIYTSLTKTINTRPRLWKNTHYLSYGIMIFIFFHAIMIGTDLQQGIWRISWIILNVVVLGFMLFRIRRAGSLSR